ncbi:MAG: L-rhamnose/proton symporter RhaT [Puia sp.]
MEQLMGIILHAIGGFSSASFYVPSYKIKRWAWQTYWISLGFVAWIIMPTVGGLLTTPDLFGIFKAISFGGMIWTYLFGVLWGFGGLMAGLGLRYLGLSLGQSISLGVCAIVGTLVPAFIDHKAGMLFTTIPGAVILFGFVICLTGIAFCGYAGVLKDRLLTDYQKKESVKEFSAFKGLIMAILGGVMSAFMALAINAGSSISDQALKSGTQKVFMNIPIFVLALGGGFTTNFVYTIIMNIRNKSFGDYVHHPKKILLTNYLFSILSGLMWYGQFFFYGMGATKMGKYGFASWTLHMATIIIFSNLWGLWLKEWVLVSARTKRYLWLGISLLILSVICIGVGNHMAGSA